jgi:hypothetical protein
MVSYVCTTPKTREAAGGGGAVRHKPELYDADAEN